MTAIKNNLFIPETPQGVAQKTIKTSFKAIEDDRFVKQKQEPVITKPAILQHQNSQLAKMIEMQKQAEKEQKKAKHKQNLSWGLGIGASLVLILALLPQALGIFRKGGNAAAHGIRSSLEQEAVSLKPRDVMNKPSRHLDCYSDEVKNFLKRLDELFTRKDIELKGGKRIAQVQFLGPGGTGKTDSADLIAKKIIEKHPGSEYYVPDLSMLTSSSFRGQDVQMLSEYTTAICSRADALAKEGQKTGVKKYVIMFLDEYDKIAMEDFSHNKHDSNKTTGALKTLINELKERDNVIIMSATNYPELIEGAIDSRMAEKVLFDYLTPKQIITAITEHYKNLKDTTLIAKELLDAKNPKMIEICNIIGKKEHQVEYRKIFDDILKKTLHKSPDMGKIELKHFVEALTEPSSVRSLNLTLEEISKLKKIVS